MRGPSTGQKNSGGSGTEDVHPQRILVSHRPHTQR